MTSADFPYEDMPEHTFDLSERTVVITGGAGHLGSALSQGLADSGAHVHLVGRTAAKLKDAASEIAASGGSCEVSVVDLTDTKALSAFTDDLVARESVVDVLINNAYSGPTGTLQSATAHDYARSYHIAVVVAAELLRGLEPCLTRAVAIHGDASVINIASMYGHVSPAPEIYGDSGQNSPPHYGAAKGALIQFTRYAAIHLARRRIRVNAISPGPFPPMRFREEKPEFYRHLVDKVPVKRIGIPQDLVGPTVFLASPNSQFVTGTNLCVDGGWTAW